MNRGLKSPTRGDLFLNKRAERSIVCSEHRNKLKYCSQMCFIVRRAAHEASTLLCRRAKQVLVDQTDNDLSSRPSRCRILNGRLTLGDGENPVDDWLNHALTYQRRDLCQLFAQRLHEDEPIINSRSPGS